MEIKEIMEAFAARAGVTDFAPDEEGVYHFGFDDMRVTFAEAGGRLLTLAEVGEVPPEGRERLYGVLLESMFLGGQTKGASFALDAETNLLYLQRFDALEALSHDGFRAMLEEFVHVLEDWRGIVSDFRDAAPGQVRAAKAAAKESRELSFGDFMRV